MAGSIKLTPMLRHRQQKLANWLYVVTVVSPAVVIPRLQRRDAPWVQPHEPAPVNTYIDTAAPQFSFKRRPCTEASSAKVGQGWDMMTW
jgi:hypothetical protein